MEDFGLEKLKTKHPDGLNKKCGIWAGIRGLHFLLTNIIFSIVKVIFYGCLAFIIHTLFFFLD